MLYHSVRYYFFCTSMGMAITAFAGLAGAPENNPSYQTNSAANSNTTQQNPTPWRSSQYQNAQSNSQNLDTQNGGQTTMPTLNQTPQTKPKRYGEREAIAQVDRNSDKSLYNRNINRGNWDTREGWRYDKQAFYSGENQNQAYDEEYPGMRGIGYNAYDPYFYAKESNGYYPDSYYSDPNADYSSYSTTGVYNRPNDRYTGYNTYPSVGRDNLLNPNSGSNFDRNRGPRRR